VKTRELYKLIRDRLNPKFSELGYEPVKGTKLPSWAKPWKGKKKLVFFSVDPRYPFNRATGGDFTVKFLLSDSTDTDNDISTWNDSHHLLMLDDPVLFSEINTLRRQVTEKILAKEPDGVLDEISLITFRSLAELEVKLNMDQVLRPHQEQFWHYLDRHDLEQWLDLIDRWLPRIDAYLDEAESKP
jgi:hypothetical protein